MTNNEFMKGCGFWMRRAYQSRVVSIYKWEDMIADMIYQGRLEIWRQVKAAELPQESLITNSMPKLRKMLHRDPPTVREKPLKGKGE